MPVRNKHFATLDNESLKDEREDLENLRVSLPDNANPF